MDVRDYLDELDDALRELPRERRREITRDIEAHIESALAEAPERTPAVIASVLDDLGTPAEIAAAADAERAPVRPRVAWRDVLVIVLLLVGGFVVPFVGWAVGVVLLWVSTTWGTRDKLIGTLMVPGGLLAPALLYAWPGSSTLTVCSGQAYPATPSGAAGVQLPETCTTTGGFGAAGTIFTVALFVFAVVGPLFTTFWLIRHARRQG